MRAHQPMICVHARAFVQSAAATMGLVPVTLPFFRVAAPNGKEATEALEHERVSRS